MKKSRLIAAALAVFASFPTAAFCAGGSFYSGTPSGVVAGSITDAMVDTSTPADVARAPIADCSFFYPLADGTSVCEVRALRDATITGWYITVDNTTKASDTSLSSMTTTVSAGDWIFLVVDSVTTTTSVDVWKDTDGNYPPAIADSIVGSEKPSVSATVAKSIHVVLVGKIR